MAGSFFSLKYIRKEDFMSAWDRIAGENLALQRQVSPDFKYFKIDFRPGEYRIIQATRVENGFGYLLRYVTAYWYNYATNLFLAGAPLGNPDIEFYVKRQSRQSDPIPLLDISTPADLIPSNILPLVPGAQTRLSPILGSHHFLNFFFAFGEHIEFHLTRAPNALDLVPVPVAYTVLLVLKGYNCPEVQSRIW
jgi:hypothetical protein